MRFLTQIELAAGSFDGPIIEADGWAHAEELAEFTGCQIVGVLEGEDDADELPESEPLLPDYGDRLF